MRGSFALLISFFASSANAQAKIPAKAVSPLALSFPVGMPVFTPAPSTRLIIGPSPNGQWLLSDETQAIDNALSAVPQVRVIGAEGRNGLFLAHLLVEASPSSASDIARRLRLLGLDVVSLNQIVSLMGRKHESTVDERSLLEMKAFFENGGLEARAEGFGRVASAVELGAIFSQKAKPEAADILYFGTRAVLNAFGAIRADQRASLYKAMGKETSRDKKAIMARESEVQARLAQPDNQSEVEPIRAVLARAAMALQDLNAPYSASYINALLPYGDYAAAEVLARSPERASAFVDRWMNHLNAAVVESGAFVILDRGTEHYRRSGGVGGAVIGHRESISYWKSDRRPFRPETEPHYSWLLLGMSDAAVQTWARRFVDVLVRTDEWVDLVRLYGAKEGDPIDGFTVIDNTLATPAGFLGPYDGIIAGFDRSRYAMAVSVILGMALDQVQGKATLTKIVDAALELTSTVDEWDVGIVLGVRKTIGQLRRAARAKASKLGLKLRPS